MKTPDRAARLSACERPKRKTPIMYQNWRNLLFLHWEYDAAVLQSKLPDGLTVDTFEGKAYVGVVPFFIQDVRAPYLPPIPGFSRFEELNVRTYVHDRHGVPGVWFFSLDANHWLAVQGARTTFNLPYCLATIRTDGNKETGETGYNLKRSGDFTVETQYRYRPKSFQREDAGTASASNQFRCETLGFSFDGMDTRTAEPDTIDFFFLERYVLFTYLQWKRTLYRMRVHHVPYPLAAVDLTVFDENMFLNDGLDKPKSPLAHSILSPGVDVEIFGLESIE